MPRGIVPATALLIIASAYSRFGTIPTPAPAQADLATKSLSVNVTPPPAMGADSGKLSGVKATSPDHCKYPSACLPRDDFGPWVAACIFTSQRQGFTTPDRSPLVEENFGRPLNEQVSKLAGASDLVSVPSGQATPDVTPGERWCLSPALKIQIKPIVVTLPDPVQSHLLLEFDRRLDAIEAAALDAGFFLDQFWIPWAGADLPLPADPDKARAEHVLRSARLKQPGLQIFRSKDAQHALFVFLVGETTTLGVNKAQLNNAIKYVRDVLAACGHTDQGEISIVGPSSSGAIPSLIEVLQNVKDNGTFQVVPSSATDNELLGRLAANDFIHSHAVLHDDHTALERFFDFTWEKLGIQPHEIAILSESETAYGSELSPLQGVPCTESVGGPSLVVTLDLRQHRLVQNGVP